MAEPQPKSAELTHRYPQLAPVLRWIDVERQRFLPAQQNLYYLINAHLHRHPGAERLGHTPSEDLLPEVVRIIENVANMAEIGRGRINVNEAAKHAMFGLPQAAETALTIDGDPVGTITKGKILGVAHLIAAELNGRDILETNFYAGNGPGMDYLQTGLIYITSAMVAERRVRRDPQSS